MAGSVHGSDTVPKRPTGRFVNSQAVKTNVTTSPPVDRLARIKDEIIAQFNKRTKGLSNNECVILARELAIAFGVTADFCGKVD